MDGSGEAARILAINTGSSSLKAGIYRQSAGLPCEARILIDLGGPDGGRVVVRGAGGEVLIDRRKRLNSHADALVALTGCLREAHLDAGIVAIGHRVVHGGREHAEPKPITPALVDGIKGIVSLAPEHLPQALEAIEALGLALPGVPQVACFDTSFHRTMPRVAQMYGLPHAFQEQGVLRYGFHGLSCESIVHRLADLDEVAGRRVIIAHLGNGASMTAIFDGRSVETTMGFTPAGGLVMATRSGDLDPGILLYLAREQGLHASEVARMVNRESGMLGVSGVTGDMRQLLALERSDARAADAIGLFCYQARKLLGGLIAVLGGLDTLVFTGGIGEHAAAVRERICSDLACFGIHLDPARNREHAPLISSDGGPVKVRVLATDEEGQIVRHTAGVLAAQGGDHVSI